MVTWYWSADNLIWQVSIGHDKMSYQKSTRYTKAACLCQPIIWKVAAILRDSTVVVAVVVVVVVVRTRPRAILIAMITTRKSIHGFPLVSYMGIRFNAVCIYGACLKCLLPEPSIPAAGQKDRWLWGREWCKPGQTTTTSCNIHQCCMKKFDQFQIWPIMSQHVATSRNRVAKRTQHVAPNNVEICCVEILRSFGRGFTIKKCACVSF